MIARLLVLLPFHLLVPEGERYPVFHYEDRGYRVSEYPPGKSDRPTSLEAGDEVRLDGVRAVEADVLRIEFQKDDFDRREEALFDPPLDVIQDAIKSFLTRLRYAARAPQVRPAPVDFPLMTYRIIYLNDDGTELPKAEGLVRVRGRLRFSFSYIALNGKVWGSIHELPVDFEPTPWEELLLDAQGDLPRIGPAVVLAATALEVFIGRKLDELASLKSLSPDLWTWITDRGNYLRDPTVEEQYDVLLRCFTGYSLKSERQLWDSFMNLKSARNSFVHEGVARVGGAPVSVDDAKKLVDAASNVISKVREWLPEELHWPVFRHQVQIEMFKRLQRETPQPPESPADKAKPTTR